MKISIVVPCYESGRFLENTITELVSEMEKGSLNNYEIILINDGSEDMTFEVIRKLTEQSSHIIGLNFAKHFGEHSALMAGFHHLSGDIIVCMDDRGTISASEIHKLIAVLSEDCDVVFARYQIQNSTRYKTLGRGFYNTVMEYMLKKPKSLYLSNHFAAKRYIIEEVKRYSHSYPNVIGLVLRSTKRIRNVDIIQKCDEKKASAYLGKKSFGLNLNNLTTFSMKPLRIANLIGCISCSIGLDFLIIVLINRLVYGDSGVIGWSSIISVMLFIGGLSMCMLGIIGEYVGRIYLCINASPQYVIREKIN